MSNKGFSGVAGSSFLESPDDGPVFSSFRVVSPPVEPIRRPQVGVSEQQQFDAMAERGLIVFMSVLTLMRTGKTQNVLQTIAEGENMHIIACFLAQAFHGNLSMHVVRKKARGYDELRKFVSARVAELRRQKQEFPENYSGLANRLFTNRHLSLP